MNISLLIMLTLAYGHSPQPFPADAAVQLLMHDAKEFKNDIECIAIDGADPSPDLLATIKRSLPLAAPQSECTKADQYVVHRPSGKHAPIVSISGFTRTSPTTATAEYSVNAGPLAGNWSTATFVLSNGKWKLVSVEQYMAS